MSAPFTPARLSRLTPTLIMHTLATLYRSAQFAAHKAHHDARGPTFKQDHEWLGSLYDTYSNAFDRLVERMKGNRVNFDEHDLNAAAVRMARNVPESTPHNGFDGLLALEKDALDAIKELMAASPDDGDQNLLQDLADEAKVRIYLIQQRLA